MRSAAECSLLAEVEAFDGAQDHQRRETLSRRWAFVDHVSAIGRGDRLDIVAVLARKILNLVQAACRLQFPRQRLRDVALIEGARPVLCDLAQGGGERRVTELVAHAWCLSARQEFFARIWIARQLVGLPRPVPGDTRGDAHALFGEADRGRQHVGEWLRAVVPVEGTPRGDRARNGHRVAVILRRSR